MCKIIRFSSFDNDMKGNGTCEYLEPCFPHWKGSNELTIIYSNLHSSLSRRHCWRQKHDLYTQRMILRLQTLADSNANGNEISE